MRGKVFMMIGFASIVRITPAHAGKRIEQRIRDYVSEDHPRACGEKTNAMEKASSPLGSPPRMRGKECFS